MKEREVVFFVLRFQYGCLRGKMCWKIKKKDALWAEIARLTVQTKCVVPHHRSLDIWSNFWGTWRSCEYYGVVKETQGYISLLRFVSKTTTCKTRVFGVTRVASCVATAQVYLWMVWVCSIVGDLFLGTDLKSSGL